MHGYFDWQAFVIYLSVINNYFPLWQKSRLQTRYLQELSVCISIVCFLTSSVILLHVCPKICMIHVKVFFHQKDEMVCENLR